METLPSSGDLRAQLEQTYYQGNTNHCGGYGLGKTPIECGLQREGIARRVSALWLYWRSRKFGANPEQDLGSDFNHIRKTLQTIGFLFEDQYDPSVPPESLDELAKANGRLLFTWPIPTPGNSTVNGIKRSIAMGYAVSIAINIREGFWEATNNPSGTPWKQHGEWSATSPIITEKHICCIVGYDDGSQRFCVEDSSGSDAFDGGFWGLPYSLAASPTVVAEVARLELIPGTKYRPLEGFMPEQPPVIPTYEAARMLEAMEPFCREQFALALFAGPQALIDLCRKFNFNEKWLCKMFGLSGDFFRKFKDANPTLNWEGFPWWPQ